MASIISKTTDNIVAGAQDVAETTADGMKNIAQKANAPTPLTPTPPDYT